MSYRTANGPRRSFESLENRAMLAANVVASVVGGCLNICGDAKGDQFVVHQLSSGDWLVAGINGTKINGQKTGTFSEVECITIKTLGGKDVVGVAGGYLPGALCIDTGSGDDVVALAALKVGSVNVSTGAGNDVLIVAGLETPKPEQTTDSEVPQGLSKSFSSVCLDTGDGTNIVLLAAIKTENLSFRSGKGSDFVGLAGVCVDECLSVDTGAGVDMLGIIDSSAGYANLAGGNQPGDLLATAQNSFGGSSSNFKTTLKLDSVIKSLENSFKSEQKIVLGALSGFGSFPMFKI